MRGLAFLRRAQYAFWVAGALLCILCAAAYLEAHYYQATENRRLEEALRRSGPRGDAASPRVSVPRTPGSLVGRLEIPRLGLSAIVLEGSGNQTLRLGVGRIPDSADPGERGNMVLGGHRDTFFRPLRAIRAGDRISLTTLGGTYGYAVEWTKVVDPEDTRPLKATPDRSLTLVTCYPFHYIGPAPQRFIVRARQITPEGSDGAPRPVASEAPAAAVATVSPAVAPPPLVIPARTHVRVRLAQTLDTKTARSGGTFVAILDEPVIVGHRAAIPKGTRFTGAIVEAKSSGRFRGRARLEVALRSFRLHGVTYRVATAAAAGSASDDRDTRPYLRNVVLTGRKNVRLPDETPLVFSLRSSVAVRRS